MNGLAEFEETMVRLLGQTAYNRDPLLVAVSGGVDSMVLLSAVASFAKRHDVPCLAAHIDHGLRPESTADAACVQATANELQIGFATRSIMPGAIPLASSLGVEADARVLRYQLLQELATENGTRFILLAHHADDQLETLMWRLMRGTSRSGLAGMREVNEREGFFYIRPLLGISKRELRLSAEEQCLPHVEDASNRADDYMRNKIRHHILPTMYELAPAVAKQTDTLMRLMQDENDYLDGLARELLDSCCKGQTPTAATLAVAPLLDAPLPLQRRAIHILLYCLTSLDWTFSHIESILQMARSTSPSGSVSLPAPWSAWRDYDVLHVGQVIPDEKASVTPAQGWQLHDGARFTWQSTAGASWQFTCRALDPTTKRKRSTRFETCVPAVESLRLQTEHTSLRIQPLGLNGHRKLQDCFVDAKVPRRFRAVWPIAYIKDCPVWVPGVIRTNDYQVQADSDSGWLLTCHLEMM